MYWHLQIWISVLPRIHQPLYSLDSKKQFVASQTKIVPKTQISTSGTNRKVVPKEIIQRGKTERKERIFSPLRLKQKEGRLSFWFE
jgi:hypothetical protein